MATVVANTCAGYIQLVRTTEMTTVAANTSAKTAYASLCLPYATKNAPVLSWWLAGRIFRGHAGQKTIVKVCSIASRGRDFESSVLPLTCSPHEPTQNEKGGLNV